MHRIVGGKKPQTIPIFFLSEIRNFNIGGPVNQLIKIRPYGKIWILGVEKWQGDLGTGHARAI
jgi:hypothetical protein